MGEKIAQPKPKSTFRRLDKYLYVARTLFIRPDTVIAVCVMSNSGRGPHAIARELKLTRSYVQRIITAAEPFLRKRKVKP